MQSSPSSPLSLLVAALCSAFAGAIFASADAALQALPESRLHALASQESTDGAVFARFQHDRARIQSRWLVGRVTATATMAVLVNEAMIVSGFQRWAEVTAIAAVLLGYGALAEVLCTLARKRAEVMGMWALRYLAPIELLLAPVAEPFAALGRFVRGRVTETPAASAEITHTEVEWVVSEGQKTGAIPREPAEFIRNALEFKDLKALEVMVPRTKVTAIEARMPLADVLALVAQEGHSRYPVYRETLDNVVGVLYAKDLFGVVRDGRLGSAKLHEIVRTTLLFAAETQPAASIFREMRARRLHLAIVSDEFGGISGIITLEDLLEELVGDIDDEFDSDEDAPVRALDGGRFVVDATIALGDLGEVLGREFPDEAGFESLGGLLVQRAGRVPLVGATIRLDGLKFVVREADPTRVVKVEIIPDDAPEPPTS